MAVDYGDVRTGIAISDESATLAGEVLVICETGMASAAEAIAVKAKERDVGSIVVGYPKNMNGAIGPRAEKSEQLAESLRKLCDNVNVVLWDERMTTMSAHQILTDAGRHGKKRKNAVDAVAASLILEGYLRSIVK